jgi:hypothetical protein
MINTSDTVTWLTTRTPATGSTCKADGAHREAHFSVSAAKERRKE